MATVKQKIKVLYRSLFSSSPVDKGIKNGVSLIIFNGSMSFLNLFLVIVLYILKATVWPVFLSNFFMFTLALFVSFYLFEVNKQGEKGHNKRL